MTTQTHALGCGAVTDPAAKAAMPLKTRAPNARDERDEYAFQRSMEGATPKTKVTRSGPITEEA